MRHKRFHDVHSAGKSKHVPFKKDEDWRKRHERRKIVALEKQEHVRQWCEKNSFKMDIKNKGHHWIFITSNNKSVQWFPSTGKLAIGENWKQGIHVHDVYQLIDILTRCKEEKTIR